MVGSVLTSLFILISLAVTTWLSIYAFQERNILILAVSVVMLAITISGAFLGRDELSRKIDFRTEAVAFSIGFLLWLGIASTQSMSVLSVSSSYLYNTIAGDLPLILEFVVNSFLIPIAEEVFWIIGLPYALIAIMNNLGQTYKPFSNKVFQFLTVILIGGVTFVIFHVGQLFWAFVIAAFIFRSIMISAVIGDRKFGWLPYFNLVPAFAIGAHIGNNWGAFGLLAGLQILVSNPMIGIPLLLLLGLILFFGLQTILQKIMRKKLK
jgi:hypothetical protein